MSYDGVNQPEPLAITAAAAALMVSGEEIGCLLCDGGSFDGPWIIVLWVSRGSHRSSLQAAKLTPTH
jgi:hypothetical protein